MPQLSRRRFVTAAAAGATLAALRPGRVLAQARPRVVVIGGGFGGASVARWLRRTDEGIDVTLVERNARFVTCPFSNLVLGGLRSIDQVSFGYDGVRRAGIEVVQDTAVSIDAAARRVTLQGGRVLVYDRLVLAPGIQLIWNGIEGYDEAAAEIMPHAWQAGPQTVLLRRQLEAMDDGGVVVIAVPDNPYRCPPGPYERASLIAGYLKASKPRSKLLILDAKESFSKQPLFQEAWRTLYPGLVEWRPKSQSGRVVAVKAKDGIVSTEFDDIRPAVANIVPPQRAGQIAIGLGLDEGRGFCSVDPRSFESKVAPGIHLVGDAIVAGAMPKSGFSANSQAKVCARAIVALLRGRPVEEPVLLNTCYSFAAADYGFAIFGAFRPGDSGLLADIPGTVGTSPLAAPAQDRAQEARYAESWYANITADMFG
jgi:sulfide dehydrogenase [flavocytochrome c] flavoprotein subunit